MWKRYQTERNPLEQNIKLATLVEKSYNRWAPETNKGVFKNDGNHECFVKLYVHVFFFLHFQATQYNHLFVSHALKMF